MGGGLRGHIPCGLITKLREGGGGRRKGWILLSFVPSWSLFVRPFFQPPPPLKSHLPGGERGGKLNAEMGKKALGKKEEDEGEVWRRSRRKKKKRMPAAGRKR